MAVINRTGCNNAIYEMHGDYVTSIRIKKGAFVCRLGLIYSITIETSVVDTYLFWMLVFDKYKYTLHDEESSQLAGLFEVADGRVRLNGKNIRPYCNFTLDEYENIWLEEYKCGINYDRFVALSAAVNGSNILY